MDQKIIDLFNEFTHTDMPRREFMENAKALWEKLGLPPLRPEAPWHGYSLAVAFAALHPVAARGVPPNTPTRAVEGKEE